MIVKMLFLSFNNANIKFAKPEKLIWRFYLVVKVLPTINQVELMNKKEFVKTVLDKNAKTFIMYFTALKTTKSTEMLIHLI